MVVYPDDDVLVRSAEGPILPGSRPAPPKDLTSRQKAIWRDIVGAVDRDWFSETHPLLTELCAHTDYAREIAGRIEEVRRRLAGLPMGSKEEAALSRHLASLLRQHGKQSASIANLSTKLRLTPQARQSARAADQVRRRTGTKPWEGWEGGR
jgi:hypothetical protein